MAWARAEMLKNREEWRQPPGAGIRAEVPYSSRIAFGETGTYLIGDCIGLREGAHKDDPLAWFIFLRLFPVLVMRDTSRSGKSAANEISRRLSLWQSWKFEQLATEWRQPRAGKSASVDPTEAEVEEHTLDRAAQHCADGEYSRGAGALDGARKGDTSGDNADALRKLHPARRAARWFHRNILRWLQSAESRIKLDADCVAQCLGNTPKSTALYLQPRHLRCIGQTPAGVDVITTMVQKVINGDVPTFAKEWLYDHKIVAFDKMSKHQADLHRREVASAKSVGGEPPKPKLRPIAIGDAVLRLAERSYCRQMKKILADFLMPMQFGVAVDGGLSLWSTVVEGMLQRDKDNVFLSIDLTNCFNAMDRDLLIVECMKHEALKPLARYVERCYPSGMVAWVEVEWGGMGRNSLRQRDCTGTATIGCTLLHSSYASTTGCERRGGRSYGPATWQPRSTPCFRSRHLRGYPMTAA